MVDFRADLQSANTNTMKTLEGRATVLKNFSYFYLINKSNFKVNQFNIKNESRSCWNQTWEAPISICIVWWTSKLGFLTLLKLGNALIPTFYYLTHSYFKFEWYTSVNTRIKLLSICQLSSVVNFYFGPCRTYRTSSYIDLINLESI